MSSSRDRRQSCPLVERIRSCRLVETGEIILSTVDAGVIFSSRDSHVF